ncbi:phosphotransferase, partial [Streptococcus danieliae]|nr:phosphotransferase [Streptococcus danieliae]
LRNFHSKKFQTKAVFNPIEILEKYSYQLQNSNFDIEEYKELIDTFIELYSPDRLCHNDLKEGNFLFTSNKIYLLDYEYSGINDPYFDIASFIAENNLNYQETITFLKSYFFDEKCNFRKLSIFLQFNDLLWYTWA